MFATYAESWVEHRSGRRPRTVELYDYQLRVHLLPAFGELAVNEITPAHVRAWHSTLMKAASPGR